MEDDREISEMLEEFLIQEAFEVVPAFDGLEACEKFEDGECGGQQSEAGRAGVLVLRGHPAESS